MRTFVKSNWKGLILSVLLAGFYILLAANWTTGIRIAAHLIQAAPPLIGWLLAMCFYLLIPMALKGGMVRLFRPRRPRWFSYVVLAVAPIVFLGLLLLFFFRDKIDWPVVMKQHHWSIFFGTSVALSCVLFFGLLLGADIEEFLDGFKTFPLLSPFLCFSAPAAWKDALSKFGVSDGNATALAMLLFAAGILFVFCLVFLWTAKAHKKRQTPSGSLLGPDGAPIQTQTPRPSIYFPLSLACLIAGMLPTFLAVFELAFVIAGQPKHP